MLFTILVGLSGKFKFNRSPPTNDQHRQRTSRPWRLTITITRAPSYSTGQGRIWLSESVVSKFICSSMVADNENVTFETSMESVHLILHCSIPLQTSERYKDITFKCLLSLNNRRMFWPSRYVTGFWWSLYTAKVHTFHPPNAL